MAAGLPNRDFSLRRSLARVSFDLRSTVRVSLDRTRNVLRQAAYVGCRTDDPQGPDFASQRMEGGRGSSRGLLAWGFRERD